MSASSDVQETGTAQESQPSVVMRRLRINAATVDARDCWRPYLEGSIVSLRTKGDGACSIHGLLGNPDGMGLLTHPNPRGWINDILLRAGSFSDLSVICSTVGQEQV